MELQGWKPQSPWGKRIYAQGMAKGEAKGVAKGKALGLAEGEARGVTKGKALGLAEGKAEGKAESVLALLRLRGIPLTRAQREEIRSCRNARRLQTWLRRAVKAASAADLFEPRRHAS